MYFIYPFYPRTDGPCVSLKINIIIIYLIYIYVTIKKSS